MTDLITTIIVSIVAVAVVTLRKKISVRNYIRTQLPDVWHDLGLTEKLDEYEIRKEDNFRNFISRKHFEHLNDERLSKLCYSYIKWGRVFQIIVVLWSFIVLWSVWRSTLP